MRILVADPIAQEGVELLRQAGEVDVITKLKPEDLVARIGEYDALVVRSETKVTAAVIAAGAKLRVIGRAGVGVDNIDVPAATTRGITVVYSPTGNTMAATEHTIALLMAMARHVPQAYRSLKDGRWDRSKYVGVEVRGKTLGVIGLGRIGTEVARRAIGLQMRVLAYDPFVAPQQASAIGIELGDIDRVIAEADFLTVHTPLTDQTKGLIGAKQLATMKPTARIVNCARGGIIDEQALYDAVETGVIAGAAVDVFTVEPTTDNVLIRSDKIIVTPHLGASTEEAQVQVAVDVAEQIIDIANGRPPRYAVNLPMVAPETMAALQPYLPLVEKLGEMATQLAESSIREIKVGYYGDIAEYDTSLLRAALIKGVLERYSDDAINFVNANLIARQRGLRIIEEKQPAEGNYSNLIRITLTTDAKPTVVAGSVLRNEPHVVQIDDYAVDITPEGILLLCHNQDRPGVIGMVGALLGNEDINISFMQVGRDHPRGRAIMVVGVDDLISDSVLERVKGLPGIADARLVRL